MVVLVVVVKSVQWMRSYYSLGRFYLHPPPPRARLKIVIYVYYQKALVPGRAALTVVR